MASKLSKLTFERHLGGCSIQYVSQEAMSNFLFEGVKVKLDGDAWPDFSPGSATAGFRHLLSVSTQNEHSMGTARS